MLSLILGDNDDDKEAEGETLELRLDESDEDRLGDKEGLSEALGETLADILELIE